MDDSVPVYKVGLVVLDRANVGAPQTFLLRPKPRNAGEQAPFVPPRGSRKYRDEQGHWQDIRDEHTARRVAPDTLEPLAATLLREAAEEAGIAGDALKEAAHHHRLFELGPIPYKNYQIHWFVLDADQALRRAMQHPVDAQETCWATTSKLGALGVSEGYQGVIRQALQQIESKLLPRFKFAETTQEMRR